MILHDKSFAVLGLGGIANNVLQHLLALGCRKLLLVDFDTVAVTDLHRQLFYTEEDLGRLKAEAMRDRLLEKFPSASIEARNLRIGSMEQVLDLVTGVDFVLRSADSPPEIDNWINDSCLVRGVPFLVSGTMEQKGLLGPLVIPFETACVNCSETVEFSEHVGDEKRRTVLFYNRVTPVLGMMVGLLGDFLAAEVAAYFSAPESCRLTRGFYLFDFVTLKWRFLHTERKASTCPSCGTRENIARYLPC
jgi:molybdopterin/thiamine biosynthesis adenylyltransferase